MPFGGLSPVGIQQFFDNNGNPLAGGSLGIFLAGTTTPTPAFADVNLSVPLANPIILDAAGRAPELFLGALTYKQVLKNALGTTIWTADNIVTPSALRSVSSNSSISGSQHDVPVPQGVVTYMQFSNTTPLTIDGFAGGTPGQVLILQAVGPGVVNLINHDSSTSAPQNQLGNFVLSGPTSMTQFAGSALYIYQNNIWRLVTHEQGHWIRVPYNAANFAGNPGSIWTVDAADITQMDYKLVGTNLLVTVAVENSSLDVDSVHLHVANWPYAFQTAVKALPASGRNSGTTYELVALGMPTVGTRELVFAKASLLAWTAAANTINLFAQALFDVQ